MVGVAALGAAVVMPVMPAEAQEVSIIQIAAVLASRDKHSFDPRLQALRADLRSLPFKSYQLVAARSCSMHSGDQCGMQVPDDGYLQLTTTETTAKHLKVRLILNRANRPIVNADLKLDRNAGVLLTSSRTGGGTIIISVKAVGPPPTESTGPATAGE
jgi:hypothetical protein